MEQQLITLAKQILTNTREQARCIEADDSNGLNDALDARLAMFARLRVQRERGGGAALPPEADALLREASELHTRNIEATRERQKALEAEYAKRKQHLRNMSAFDRVEMSDGLYFNTAI